MADLIEKGFTAMRQLRLDSEQVLREARDLSLSEPSMDYPMSRHAHETFETEDGLVITKTGDSLDLSADFVETNNGRWFDTTYEVEFPEDLRNWPNVTRTIYNVARGEIRTIPRRRFYEVAGLLSRLIVAREIAS